MKIVHVSSSDSGGAGIAAVRLNNALNSIGVDSKVLCIHKSKHNENVVQFEQSIGSKLLTHSHFPIYQNKYLNRVKEFETYYEAVSFPEAFYDISSSPLIQEADIINLHWVGSILNYKKFFRNVKKPIIWTLHDMNPFMGISHYMGDYTNNLTKFGSIENQVRDFKKKAIQNAYHLEIVCLCEWMKRYSQHSDCFKQLPHHIVNNSIDIDIFTKHDKECCRKILDLPLNKNILLFCAQSISNTRKGFDILINSLPKIKSDCFVCVIGDINEGQLLHKVNFKCFGSVRDELLLSLIYSSADLFVLPSREDNLPNTMLESLCCGLPVISFTNGGMKDIIQDGFNGLLIGSQNAEYLAQGIDHFFETMDSYNSDKISSDARQHFSPTLQASKYLDIYKHALL